MYFSLARAFRFFQDNRLGMDLRTLSVEEVVHIHEVLVEEFSENEDPIFPSGVRSDHLLESAVSRQWTGLGNILKYSTPVPGTHYLIRLYSDFI